MCLRTDNVPSDVLKNDFAEFDKAMFLGVDFPCQIILCFLVVVKRDLDVVA
jgi:hypothetical protein